LALSGLHWPTGLSKAIRENSEQSPLLYFCLLLCQPIIDSMVDIETAEHYIWGEACDGWHLVKSAELSVIQERMPPGTAEVRHYHNRASQFFYVLSGTATMELNGEEQILQPRQGIEVPPGAPHQMFNRSSEPLEFLVFSQPASHGDRVIVETVDETRA
jgi:mannose-6-phosphate isomerase-like protein (cupin superfamily)